MDPGPTREMLIKQLTWEGLNSPTHNAVVAVLDEDTHKWVVATRDLDPNNGLAQWLFLQLPLVPVSLTD